MIAEHGVQFESNAHEDISVHPFNAIVDKGLPACNVHGAYSSDQRQNSHAASYAALSPHALRACAVARQACISARGFYTSRSFQAPSLVRDWISPGAFGGSSPGLEPARRRLAAGESIPIQV